MKFMSIKWNPRDKNGDVTADTIIGQYVVGHVHTGYRVIFRHLAGDTVSQTIVVDTGVGYETALLAAQHHFESTISSVMEVL